MTNAGERQDNENYSKNFTRVPNIVFSSYKYLTKEEKFLYCVLRQVYWDMKPRFVSLRDLSEATGYATGTLCKMLPRLHKCGLIHSEIRKDKDKDGKEKGNSKYHITIPDIWELNRQFFACSLEERAAFDPSIKLVQQMNESETCSANEQPCSPNDTNLFTKQDKPVQQMNNLVSFGEQDQAQVERAKDINKDILKEREKDSPLPLSPKNEEETKPLEVDYPLFDRLCQGKGYAPDFKVPRNDKNNAAIQELHSQGATPEQVEFVFNDIWDDKDPFWQQHRGKPSTVASQFTARIWKMTAPAKKRQTASGFTNWTENKSIGTVSTPSVPKTNEKPKEPSLPVGYTRLKIDKPTRPRSLQARLQQAQKDI